MLPHCPDFFINLQYFFGKASTQAGGSVGLTGGVTGGLPVGLTGGVTGGLPVGLTGGVTGGFPVGFTGLLHSGSHDF